MKFDDFEKIYNQVKGRRPLWLSNDMEPPASDAEIQSLEDHIKVKLPEEFVVFLKKVGSGYFGMTNVLSASRAGDWFLPDLMDRYGNLPKDFIPVSDDETGGYFGFKVNEGVCEKAIYYTHPDDGSELTLKYADLFEYLAKVGLGASEVPQVS